MEAEKEAGRKTSFPEGNMLLDVREDSIFDMFKTDDDKVSISKFLTLLKYAGLRKHDPRLTATMVHLQGLQKSFRRKFSSFMTDSPTTGHAAPFGSKAGKKNLSESSTLLISRDEFKHAIAGSRLLIARALTGQFVIPDWEGFKSDVQGIYEKCRTNTNGKVADYIPQLARFSPKYWGVCVCSIDGQRASWGDTKIPFSIQSASKPLNYVIALNDLGSELVHKYVGQEPSGRLFNEICLDANNKPHNPMINAGAIVTLGLIKKDSPTADRFQYLTEMYRKLAGGEHVEFSNSTYERETKLFLSERETADRNYALAYFMREHNALPRTVPVHEMLEFYFQLCSVELTCESASVIAATLANGGICPMTGEKVIQNKNDVLKVLSLMYSCGMYDYSGQFAFQVGLPAKSGVSGILLLVVPNVMGIALWSPPLDPLGNSVRGVQFCTELVEKFNFHNFDSLLHAGQKIDPRRPLTATVEGPKHITALFCAANGDLDSLKRFVIQGTDMCKGDYDGRTALHLAASEGHDEIVHFLLHQLHVPPAPRDRWGRTPLDDAKDFGDDECLKLLKPFYPEAETAAAEVVAAESVTKINKRRVWFTLNGLDRQLSSQDGDEADTRQHHSPVESPELSE